MNYSRIILIALFFWTAAISCKGPSPEQYAIEWSKDIKEKIIADASLPSDRKSFDSTYYEVVLYSGNTKLKYYKLRPTVDAETGAILSSDTVVSIFYSTDQKFELVRELCPVIDRSFEGIRYNGSHVGLVELHYCSGAIKERGYRYKGDVGMWKEYDANGNILKAVDHGNLEKLEGLKKIKYYR